eukprot:m.124471 g.124471  ORF g.124471 m.124471 type:complete len:61 (+) comp17289_c0_seq1:310-492(+)
MNLEITGTPTPRSSGAFEVQVMPDGPILFSKLNGQGYVDTDEKLAKIIEQIRALLIQQEQ